MTEKKQPEKKPAKQPKQSAEAAQVDELTADIKRLRADFENFRKRSEADKAATYSHGQTAAVMKLLPVIDNIDRAISHTPDDIKGHSWVQGVASLAKGLDKSLAALDLERIDATEGVEFNPDLHEAIQFDEDSEGETEVIAEELQPGYRRNGEVIRHAMVRVTRQ